MNLHLPDPASDRTCVPTAPKARGTQIRVLAAAAVLALSVTAAACSSGSSTSTTTGPPGSTTQLVLPPDVPLQGCTYVLNGSIPAGEPAGIQPSFAAFSPDQAAQSAVEHIAAHGGTALVTGFEFPSGISFFAGPDTTQPAVAKVPNGRSVLAAEPVLWTTSSGGEWLAFFIACGGRNLYWVSVDQTSTSHPIEGAALARSIAALKAAAPYTVTGNGSTLPIKIEKQQFEWAVAAGTHPLTPIARGQLLGF
jgi:hypothetical protein